MSQRVLQSKSVEVIKLMSGSSSVAIPPPCLPSVRGHRISRCICVCMVYVYICVCICVRGYVCGYASMCLCACVCICMYLCGYVCTCVCVCDAHFVWYACLLACACVCARARGYNI